MPFALTASEQIDLFQGLSNPYIVFRADAALTIVAQNEAHRKIAMVEPGAVLGKPLLEAFPDTSDKYQRTGESDLVNSMRRFIKTGRPDPMPLLKYDLKDNAGNFVERWWRVTHHPIFDDQHQVSLVYQATEDITETEKLKELNTVKDEFIAMASHQLRTPASTVKQYLGILIDGYAGALNEDQLAYATTANDANEREIAIIEDLLKTAQIDIKGYSLEIAPVNMVQIIEEVIKHSQPMLNSRRQKLIFKHQTDTAVVPADATELKTIIANLVENASKYSRHGTTITVAIKHAKNHIHISVSDQGVGIEPADQAKIFEKFTRVDNPLSDTVSGSGLGLYWVKRIVELHEGELDIRSELGKGTTFTIKLPI